MIVKSALDPIMSGKRPERDLIPVWCVTSLLLTFSLSFTHTPSPYILLFPIHHISTHTHTHTPVPPPSLVYWFSTFVELFLLPRCAVSVVNIFATDPTTTLGWMAWAVRAGGFTGYMWYVYVCVCVCV